MLQIGGTRPIPGVLFGVTHETDGTLIIREPPNVERAKAAGVIPDVPGLTLSEARVKGPDGKLKFEVCDRKGLATREEAEKFYRENYSKAEVCNYPRKLGFFTFTRPVIGEDGVEVFEPDFQAIEAHGPNPTEIDIVFLDDNPFSGAYQMWSASELRCKGDGINALRVLSMASTDEEKELAKESQRAGEKYFPIVQGCWTLRCPYSKESADGKPSPCKPGGDLKFQLARNIRVGGTAYFHTSGFRSISHIFSSIERIKTLTAGRLAGVPLKMVLRPYKTKHNGQAATQYGVSLEFRAEDIESLRKNLMEQALKFRSTASIEPGRKLLDAPVEPVTEDDDDEEESPISAQAMAAEFYPDDTEETPAQVNTAAAVTDAKTVDLAEKLKAKAAASKAKPAAAVVPPAAPAPAAAAVPPKPVTPVTEDMF